MQVHVQTRQTAAGDAEPVTFSLGQRVLQVCEIQDRWFGHDHAYFKVLADDGARYILRCATHAGEWELRWFSAQ